jgi:hypothetical protein
VSSNAESRWLLLALTRLFVLLLIVPTILGLFFDWPADRVGNAYQLLDSGSRRFRYRSCHQAWLAWKPGWRSRRRR